MTQKEQTRLQVLNSLMADHMTLEQAATLMGVSARHTRRILAAYRRDGAAALAHGNRGRRPANATPDPLATDVVLLARTRYAGVNHTHLSELLREREGIDIGRNTLRKILTDVGVNSPRRRRPPKHRVRRQRMAREGMLIQIDGSYHRWLAPSSRCCWRSTMLRVVSSMPCSVSTRTHAATYCYCRPRSAACVPNATENSPSQTRPTASSAAKRFENRATALAQSEEGGEQAALPLVEQGDRPEPEWFTLYLAGCGKTLRSTQD